MLKSIINFLCVWYEKYTKTILGGVMFHVGYFDMKQVFLYTKVYQFTPKSFSFNHTKTIMATCCLNQQQMLHYNGMAIHWGLLNIGKSHIIKDILILWLQITRKLIGGSISRTKLSAQLFGQ